MVRPPTILARTLARPLQYVTPEELGYFMRQNKPFRAAWQDLAPYMRERDVRGVKRWVFAMGWLACLTYHRRLIMEAGEVMAEKLRSDATRLSDNFATKTGIPE